MRRFSSALLFAAIAGGLGPADLTPAAASLSARSRPPVDPHRHVNAGVHLGVAMGGSTAPRWAIGGVLAARAKRVKGTRRRPRR